jgi:predicted DNA-binding transcriptional regulator YafY
MPRADRLYAIREMLESGRPTNIDALAQRFGVSERTIARDLAVLRNHVVIEGRPGPRGNIRLLSRGAARGPVLADDEVFALWLAVWGMASHVREGARLAQSAFAKVEQALPGDQRRRLRAMTQRLFVGRPAAEPLAKTARPPQPGVLVGLAGPFARQTQMWIEYQDAEGRITRRAVEPHALLVQAPLLYVLGFDRLRQAPRMFRIDRIRRVRTLDQPVSSHLDAWRTFDLAVAGVSPRR